MRIRLMTFICIALVAGSCGEDGNQVKKNNDALVIGDPMDCGLDSLTIFPVGCSYDPDIITNEENHEMNDLAENVENGVTYSSLAFQDNSASQARYDKDAKYEYVNTKQEDYDIRNLIFYNLLTGKSYPLIEDSIHILSFAIHKEFGKPLIFYRVVLEDYNKDEKFDGHDPVMLYISNPDGSSFTKITPETEYFIDYRVYKQTNSILIKTALDSNKDGKFRADDETNFRKMKLDEVKFAENIFDNSLKDTLRRYN